jgi:SAM-dependent methyltransferase
MEQARLLSARMAGGRLMSTEALLSVSQRLNASVEALAALGAELRLRRDGTEVEARVRDGLREVVAGLQPGLLDSVSAEQEAVCFAFIQAFFRQALDLLENPARTPGWTYEDPIVLQAMGQASRRVVHAIAELATRRPRLRATLEGPGVLLDIGTGVGWLAIEAARTWPALDVVGIDIWEPALALARKNCADSGLSRRIALRRQDVRRVDERDAFSLAWLPGPFIPRDIVDSALERVRDAVRPGGWIVFGLYAPAPDRLGEALKNLRIVRGGGHPWSVAEVETLLSGLGFEHIEAFAPGPPILFIVGQRPD